MANDCKPRSRVTPVTEPPLPLPGSCMETVPPPAPECMDGLESPGAECCPDDSEERGWYNDPVKSPCEKVVVPYGTYHSEVSQEEADLLADTAAYETLDIPVPIWESLSPSEIISPPVNIYGSLGPEEIRSGGPCNTACDKVAFCYGPVAEGVPMVDQADRYNTRWQAKIEAGYLFYRKEGEAWIAVPNELVPQPNPNLVGLGFCFDANARPCFCSQIGNSIHLWRYQAGVPFEHTFSGTGAKLFFNGVLQRDNSVWDVVCYFCENGGLCATFQRENFAITHVLYTPASGSLTRVYLVDPGSTIFDEGRFYLGVGNTCGILRTALYPPWPVVASDEGASQVYGVDSLEYALIIVVLGEYSDSGTVPTYGMESLEYVGVTVVFAPISESGTISAYGVESLAYDLTSINVGTYSEAGTAPPYGMESLSYELVAINAGTYTEPGAVPVYGMESLTYA